MKTYLERTQCVTEKIEVLQKLRRRNRTLITSSCLLLAVVILAAVLFIPYDTSAPDVSMYRGSPYYSLIQRINEATYLKPRYKNNFEFLTSQAKNVAAEGFLNDGAIMDMPLGGHVPEEAPTYGTTTDNYVEVTDNQVAGVIESDILKRSDKYLFRLHERELRIYSIAKDESELVGSVKVGSVEGMMSATDLEMYLSQDCTTVIIVSNCMSKEDKTAYVCVRTFDVTDPSSIQQTGCMFLTGSGISSRMVDGKLLLVSKFRIRSDKDFAEEATFLPQIGTPGNMESVPADNILAPENITNTQYTVITKLDGKTLEVFDSAAFLSYSDQIYVSQENIFATRTFTHIEDAEAGKKHSKTMTEISCISYTGETLEHIGSVTVDGTVKNQYSMDEFDGVLRVVTSTSERTYTEYSANGMVSAGDWMSIQNVNLYCISMEDFSILAGVRSFAPEGETAESVRFDGYMAYVCTAEVITLTDPVYFFDLSQLPKISWKDTGTIDGYSSSLVNFGEGYLLGIGFNENRCLKIEVYEESENGVVSVCSYELDCFFSQDYKAYLIDRENWIIGLGVWPETGGSQYLLLQFDGYELREIAMTELKGFPDTMRAALIDGWLYLFGDEFKAKGPIF